MDTGLNISLILAISQNNVIGKDDDIPWKIRTDMQWFKRHTLGKTVIVGRKTHEFIIARLKRPLPERRTIVITREKGYVAPQCEVANSTREALELLKPGEAAFVIGGAEVYKAMIGLSDRIYLTRVQAEVEGDTFFPIELHDGGTWDLVSREPHPKSEKDEYPFTFEVWERKNR